MHILAAFQIFKEMLNNGELQTTHGVDSFVRGDKGSLVCESTDVKTLQDKVSDLQYQVFAEYLVAEYPIFFHIFPRVYCFISIFNGTSSSYKFLRHFGRLASHLWTSLSKPLTCQTHAG